MDVYYAASPHLPTRLPTPRQRATTTPRGGEHAGDAARQRTTYIAALLPAAQPTRAHAALPPSHFRLAANACGEHSSG